MAKLLSCTDQYVYILIKNGKLTAIKIGKRALRISESSVNTFIAAGKVNPADYFAPADPEPKKRDPQPAGTARSKWMSK